MDKTQNRKGQGEESDQRACSLQLGFEQQLSSHRLEVLG